MQQFCIPFSKEDSFLISEFKLNSLVGVKKREKEKGSKIDRKIFKNAFRLIYNIPMVKKKKNINRTPLKDESLKQASDPYLSAY